MENVEEKDPIDKAYEENITKLFDNFYGLYVDVQGDIAKEEDVMKRFENAIYNAKQFRDRIKSLIAA